MPIAVLESMGVAKNDRIVVEPSSLGLGQDSALYEHKTRLI